MCGPSFSPPTIERCSLQAFCSLSLAQFVKTKQQKEITKQNLHNVGVVSFYRKLSQLTVVVSFVRRFFFWFCFVPRFIRFTVFLFEFSWIFHTDLCGSSLLMRCCRALRNRKLNVDSHFVCTFLSLNRIGNHDWNKIVFFFRLECYRFQLNCFQRFQRDNRYKKK